IKSTDQSLETVRCLARQGVLHVAITRGYELVEKRLRIGADRLESGLRRFETRCDGSVAVDDGLEPSLLLTQGYRLTCLCAERGTDVGVAPGGDFLLRVHQLRLQLHDGQPGGFGDTAGRCERGLHVTDPPPRAMRRTCCRSSL